MKNKADLTFEKGLPANLYAERLILGSILLNDSVYSQIAGVLKMQDFTLDANRRIFSRMKDLDERGLHIDRVILADELTRRNELESVGGLEHLISLDEGLPEVPNLDCYVAMVRDKSRLRTAIYVCQQLIDECFMAADPTPEILARAENAIATLTSDTDRLALRTPMQVVERAGGFESILKPDRLRGIATPWPLLNRMLVGGGFTPGQMVVVGARPSIGKTALACQIADHVASDSVGVAFFTLEMPDQAILLRMAAARAQVDVLKLTQQRMNQREVSLLSEAFADLTDEKYHLWIDDSTCCTIPAVRSALRRLGARNPIGLVVIDYLQLIDTIGGRERRRYEQVTEISRGLKRLAREFNVPILVLAQLNRESEKDPNSRPHPSQLRDSGSIEQDADIILMPARVSRNDDHPDTVDVELIIAKQRNGPTGVVPLRFLKRFAKFVEFNSMQAPTAR